MLTATLQLITLRSTDPNEAKTTLEQAHARNLEGGYLHQLRYYLAFINGDAAEMERQVAWGAGKPGDEDGLLSAQSDTEAYHGRIVKAREFSRRAVDSAIRAGSKEAAALWQVNAALREAEFGNAAAAKQGITAALALAPGRDVKVSGGPCIGAHRRYFPRRRPWSSSWRKATHRIQCSNSIGCPHSRRPLNSTAKIQPRSSYFWKPLLPMNWASPYHSQMGTLYPAYLRGQAYLMAHNGTAAATEFQKLLDHRGIVLNFPLGALAHLRPGPRLRSLRRHSQGPHRLSGLLALWKDADPDIPILKEAKAEYAKLQ